MGKGYGPYWVGALAIGLPLVGFGIWRWISRADGATDLQWANNVLGIGVVAAAALVLLALVALPFDAPLIRAKRQRPQDRIFLVRRNSHLEAALATASAAGAPLVSWAYWILVEVSESGIRLRAPAGDPTSGWVIPSDDVSNFRLGRSVVNGLPVPAMLVSIQTSPKVELPLVPSAGAFRYAWGETRIESEIQEIQELWGKRATKEH